MIGAVLIAAAWVTTVRGSSVGVGMVHLYNRVLFSAEKEGPSDIEQNRPLGHMLSEINQAQKSKYFLIRPP